MDTYEEITLYFIALVAKCIPMNETKENIHRALMYGQLIKSKLLSVLFLLHLIHFLAFAACSIVIYFGILN